MKMNKKLVAVILALGIFASVGYFGTSYVMAGENTPGYSTLVTRLSQRFNLSESDIKAVFDAVRDEKMEARKAELAKRLSQAVSDGVITEDQKSKILAKMQEHQAERKEHREEMKKWFSDNGIDQAKLAKYLRFEGGRHIGKRLR